MADYIMTASGTLDFANSLFQSKDRINANGEKVENFSCYVLIDKDTPEGQEEAKSIAKAIQDAIVAGTQPSGNYAAPLAGLNPEDKTQVSRLRLPLKDGDTDVFKMGDHEGEKRCDVYPEFKGKWFINLGAGSHHMLAEGLIRKIVDGKMVPAVQNDVYSGNKVRANIWFTAYNAQGNKGVKARLNALLITEPGEPLYERRDNDPFAGFGLPESGTESNDPFSGMGI
ncbi:ssDNA-binding protein [Bifidobacterium sp. SO1]|uniref:ssDNA-binding protein n=1 Tax=Bifidobacterium sp. SO1 TaxID=2809029 RepID=UPI001BDD7D85|nr:ssDNA-binding protein [Bifidobacterium sp. SO1]MBT1161778.1 DUF2815 family protein [Bifidobacterium sp. SO1]